MTDKEQLTELQAEIQKIEATLKPLYEKRKELKKKIEEEHEATLPYHGRGLWFKGKTEEAYLYYNDTDRTYYTKPLYRADGKLAGYPISKKLILKFTKKMQKDGYRDLTEMG